MSFCSPPSYHQAVTREEKLYQFKRSLGDLTNRRKKRLRYRISRGVATIFTLALLFCLAFWIKTRSDPGPPVKLSIRQPSIHETLPLHESVLLEGIVKDGKNTVCNNHKVTTNKQGRFSLKLPGPDRSGLFSIECESFNSKNRKYSFRFGRMAGQRAPITEKVVHAFKLKLPLAYLNQKGGLLTSLNNLVENELRDRINIVGKKLSFSIGGLRFAGISIKQASLKGISSDSDGQPVLKLEIRGFCFKGEIVPGRLALSLTPIKSFLKTLRHSRRLCIPAGIQIDLAISRTPDQKPRIKLGPLDTTTLESVGELKVLADSDMFTGLLTKPIKTALTWVGESAETLLDRILVVFREFDRRLSSLADVLPPAPAQYSTTRPRVCFDIELTKMHVLRQQRALILEASAGITGYTTKGRSCADSNHLLKFSKDSYRIAMDPPPPNSQFPQDSSIAGVAIELINAYIHALWLSGGLGKPSTGTTGEFLDTGGIPVNVPKAKRNGFDIKRINFDIPPLLTLAQNQDRKTLELSIGEAEVLLETLGEPRRLFRINGRIPMTMGFTYDDRLKLSIHHENPVLFSLRCIGESGGNPCTRQSRRYEALAETAVELIQSGEISLPRLVLWKFQPIVQTDTHKVILKEPSVIGGFLTTRIRSVSKKDLKKKNEKKTQNWFNKILRRLQDFES